MIQVLTIFLSKNERIDDSSADFFSYFRYPNVKCYAFCPPGCTVSMNLATECDEFVTSFVVGNDIIPR